MLPIYERELQMELQELTIKLYDEPSTIVGNYISHAWSDMTSVVFPPFLFLFSPFLAISLFGFHGVFFSFWLESSINF
jgi:hypothetical protein